LQALSICGTSLEQIGSMGESLISYEQHSPWWVRAKFDKI